MSTPAVSPEAVKKEFSWKRLFVKATGFGAGFALMLAILAGMGIWYWNRPKPPRPFDTKILTAKYSLLTIQRRGVGENATLNCSYQYGITNAGKFDYIFPQPATGQLLARSKETSALTLLSNASWDQGTVIPSKQTINITFNLSYRLADYNTKDEELEDEKKLRAFAKRRFDEVPSMVFFDYGNRYEIDLPPLPVINSDLKK